MPYDADLNKILKYDLDAAGFSSQLGPAKLDRGDGKRPDGMTVFVFCGDKPCIWDAICCDFFVCGNLMLSAACLGFAARKTETNKMSRYQSSL